MARQPAPNARLTADAAGLVPVTVPCVRVAPEDGERTRQTLAERDLLDRSRKITRDGEFLYVPVTDAEAVTDSVVSGEFESAREHGA
mgnify:CR=1 FL=1